MKRRLAVIGAGPVGLEAALLGALKGFDVQVYEQGEVGEHVRNWSHVTLFSPWELDRSEWGVARLRERGVALAPAGEYPTGEEFVEDYLEPLAEDPLLEGRIHTGHIVHGVSRKRLLKGDGVGGTRKGKGPFLLLVEGDKGEAYVEADVVFDTTGAYETPNPLGPGGLPALGSLECDIEHYVPDVLGADRPVYEGKHTLVVGAGYSAVTTARALADLAGEVPGTRVSWLMRGDEVPYEEFEGDTLPQRVSLVRFGNEVARGEVPGVRRLEGEDVVEIREMDSGQMEVQISGGAQGGGQSVVVDQVVANVGYRPDLELTRELQVHLCYASEGPMNLAASLGAGGDCMAASSGGIETLRSPEPDFFVLGSKSYGRNSAFLLKLGFEQVATVLESLGSEKS